MDILYQLEFVDDERHFTRLGIRILLGGICSINKYYSIGCSIKLNLELYNCIFIHYHPCVIVCNPSIQTFCYRRNNISLDKREREVESNFAGNVDIYDKVRPSRNFHLHDKLINCTLFANILCSLYSVYNFCKYIVQLLYMRWNYNKTCSHSIKF